MFNTGYEGYVEEQSRHTVHFDSPYSAALFKWLCEGIDGYRDKEYSERMSMDTEDVGEDFKGYRYHYVPKLRKDNGCNIVVIDIGE